MLKIDYFYYVIEIAEAKSISKAAENLYITQPYLSLALKRLEEELGVNLFNRTTRGVFLTTAGEKFLQYAQKIVEIISQAEHLSEEIGLDFQKLSVASMYSYTTIDLFHEFSSQKHLQGCQFTYSEMPNREVSDYVFSGNANVGILYTSLMELENFKKQLSNKSMTFTSLISEPLCAVLSAEHPLAHYKSLTLEQLKSYSFIIEKGKQFDNNYSYQNSAFPELHKHSNISTLNFDNNRSLLYYLTKNSRSFSVGQKIRNLYGPFVKQNQLCYIPLTDISNQLITGYITNQLADSSMLEESFIDFLEQSYTKLIPL